MDGIASLFGENEASAYRIEGGGDGAPQQQDGGENAAANETAADVAPATTSKRRREKLDLRFFQGDEEKGDKLWDLFLDVAARFPTLHERARSEGIAGASTGRVPDDLSTPTNTRGSSGFAADEERRKKRRLMMMNTDKLLASMRDWSQRVYPHGLSLKYFSKRVQKLTQRNEFLDYRIGLIYRYKTENWQRQALDREVARETGGNDMTLDG
eukprot:GHVU01217027.1.p1 GENE.GHVU01217027.1~~GHVU01217027.1.p1  ORF type:complete len:212 (+),score=36.50 GHVU01217027.1:34-669(+)